MPSQPVEIVETHEFKGNYKKFITEPELDAIRRLLADEPVIGKQIKDLPGLLRLDWRSGVYVIYMVSTASGALSINEQVKMHKIPLQEGEGGCFEEFSISPLSVDLSVIIYLVTIGSISPEPNGGGRKQITDLLYTLSKYGLYMGFREIVIKLYELLKEDLL